MIRFLELKQDTLIILKIVNKILLYENGTQNLWFMHVISNPIKHSIGNINVDQGGHKNTTDFFH